jgi:hypothetical protein
MTTFTSDDREEAYKKIVEAAPFQPGYEDAVPIPFAGWVNTAPPHIVDSGASVMGTSNEPVAWMVDGVLFTSLGAALNISFDIEQPCIPLYTHPAKTLTDEEIAEEWAKFYPDVFHTHLIDFARAILRKAQEK